MYKTFIVAILAFSICSAVSAQTETRQRTISATGTAWKEVTPDEIYAQISLREYNKKNNDKVDIETIRTQFLQTAKDMGLTDKDITIQSYQGWNGNIIIYKKNKKNNPDLKAGITYLVKLKSTQQADDLVDKLDDQATQSFSITKTDYSQIESLRKELQIEAAKNAREKAGYIAAAVGEQVGKAITIDNANESGDLRQPVYYSMRAKTVMADAAEAAPAPLDVDFKKIKVQYSITITFGLL